MDGYVLSLENGNYYVGITNNFNERINQHLSGKGSSWTKKHKPIDVIERFYGSKENERKKRLIICENMVGKPQGEGVD